MRLRKSRQRLIVIGSASAVLVAALGLAAVGLRNSAAFFHTPSEILAQAETPQGKGSQSARTVRIGGLVTVGSVRSEDGAAVFQLTDDIASVDVAFSGVLPSLFREGQCVIAEGALGANGRFIATRVLAKHDEQYRPPEITASPRLAHSCGTAGTAAAASGPAAS
jgi:cytochrome c-type biogenesis protein CcmE